MIHKILLSASLMIIAVINCQAQVDVPYPDYYEDVFMEWELEKNLATPVVEKGEKKSVAKYMRGVGESLKNKNYTVDMMREGEVVIVSIPSDDIFFPNDTLITPRGESLLAPLLNYMNEPYMYKIVYTVNTDDTGSKHYLDALSDKRNASLYDWFMRMIEAGKMSEDIVLIPYSMSYTAPIASNDERKGRYKNRRVEIYLIPGPEMIDKAKKKSLKR